jgi:hypothetical protein
MTYDPDMKLLTYQPSVISWAAQYRTIEFMAPRAPIEDFSALYFRGLADTLGVSYEVMMWSPPCSLGTPSRHWRNAFRGQWGDPL